MKYREASKKLKALGCEELPRRGAGSHHVWHNQKNGKIAPLPDWGAKDLKPGTLRAVIRQLGLDWQEFMNIK
jgi:mRNA interferase HicA